MHWFILAAAAPLLWAITNILDEYLVGHYYKDKTDTQEEKSLVGSLVMFSALFGIIVCIFIAFINKEVFDIPWASIKVLLLSGSVF